MLPPVVVDIKHSEALGSLHKVKPAKLGAYRAIWLNPDDSRFLVRVIQSIAATLGLALYGAGICAAWALPSVTGAFFGTFTLPIFSIIGLIRGDVRDKIKFGYMSGSLLGGVFGAGLAYGLCSLGNGITALATRGKSVKQLYAANSPKTFADFSLTFPISLYRNRDTSFREDRKVTFERIVKPVKKLNYGDYKKWGESLEAELKEKKNCLLQRTKEGNIGRYCEIYERDRTQLHGDDLKELLEISCVVNEFKFGVERISVLPAGNLHLILLAIPKYLKEGKQSEADKAVALIRRSYEETLEQLENIEKLLPQIENLCQPFVERIRSKIVH